MLDEIRENKPESCKLMTSPEDMHAHFSSLNKLPYKFQDRANEIEEELVNAENGRAFCKLDFLNTKEEVAKCLHALKSGISSGLGCISNVMIMKQHL